MRDNEWIRWVDSHAPALLLAARQWARDRATAEDILQTALLRFWPVRATAEEPLAMLYILVKNTALQHHRDARRLAARHAAAASRKPELTRDPVFARLADDERRRTIEAALDELPETQKEVLILKIWLNLTFERIAEILSIPADTAASRYRYALEKLRVLLCKEVAP
jgi:RNA polymerase sigma-70 factor (ECF subfamily)